MPQTTPAFVAELSHEHVALLSQLARLEKGLVPQSADGAGNLAGRLRELRVCLHHHFDFEEEGGYMSQALADAPHLHHQVQALLEEHARLGELLDDLIAGSAGSAPEAPVPAAVCEGVRHWLHLVRSHESRENQLVQGVCNQDIGADD
jgi:hypothetical protein